MIWLRKWIFNFKPNKYNELIDYCFNNSDYFSLTKYSDHRYILTKGVINYILNDGKVTNNELLDNDIDEMISKLSQLYKDNIDIFRIDIIQKLHIAEVELEGYKIVNSRRGIDASQKEIDRLEGILNLIDNDKYNESIDNSGVFYWVINHHRYDVNTSKFIEENKRIICSIEERNGLWGKNDKDLYTTTYRFRVCEETRKILNNNFKNVYDWCFPNTLEDLCFYRNDELWFYSISHEGMCDIIMKDEKEEEFLNSICEEK